MEDFVRGMIKAIPWAILLIGACCFSVVMGGVIRTLFPKWRDATVLACMYAMFDIAALVISIKMNMGGEFTAFVTIMIAIMGIREVRRCDRLCKQNSETQSTGQ